MDDAARDEAQAIKDLLAEHVPLALLVDLLAAPGGSSSQILAEEGLPEDAWWESGGGGPAEGSADRGATDPE
ncbi:hypothetical protein ACTHAM_002981 [Cellulomonas soli]|uniref:hypothetical protein n=1 Tax=Cellulomonas soli TaxID=931535 RepID=UPI003F8296E6